MICQRKLSKHQVSRMRLVATRGLPPGDECRRVSSPSASASTGYGAPRFIEPEGGGRAKRFVLLRAAWCR